MAAPATACRLPGYEQPVAASAVRLIAGGVGWTRRLDDGGTTSSWGPMTLAARVLVEVRNIDALHAELCQRGYPFFNPGIGSGPGVSKSCSSSTLPPTGFASTSPHQPAKAPRSVSEYRRAVRLGSLSHGPPPTC